MVRSAELNVSSASSAAFPLTAAGRGS
jgi:hypothetical protein